MNTFVVCLFAVLAVANAGIIAGPATTVLQGPSAGATLVGPDGSVVAGGAPGGTVIANSVPGGVAVSAPLLAAHSIIAPGVWGGHGGLLGNALIGPSGIVAAHGLGW